MGPTVAEVAEGPSSEMLLMELEALAMMLLPVVERASTGESRSDRHGSWGYGAARSESKNSTKAMVAMTSRVPIPAPTPAFLPPSHPPASD
jgi:hypothetical protein